MKISRILHAGYVFESVNTKIAFDPIFENPFSRNCYAFPSVQFDHEEIRNLKFDAVFISHYHDDHCSFESLDFLDRDTPIYLFCIFEELFSLIKELGFKNVQSLSLNQAVQVGSIEIIPRRALDADVDSLFQIKAEGLNVLNVVDSWIDYETLDLLVHEAPWDMVLWPFQTMREIPVLAPTRAEPACLELPEEWIEQIQKLNPKYIVPSSCQFNQEPWSWYNHAMFPISYAQFEKEMKSALPQGQVVRMNPGVSFSLDKSSLSLTSPLSWVRPMGDQNVDFDFRSDLKVPTTAQIAANFSPLSAEQTQRVFDYCRSGLLEKYRSLEISMNPYFEKPRLWQLSVYDHTGQVQNFSYQLNGAKIELVSDIDRLAWTTEVPLSKLYAALETGESLTSMYVRINDRVFSEEIEKEIQSADVVEDPLVRCLFNGSFGSYQIEQLKRIKGRAQN